MTKPFVIGITGASGAVYAVRLLEVLVRQAREVHLSISDSGKAVLAQELGYRVDLANFEIGSLFPDAAEDFLAQCRDQVRYYHYRDYMAPMASGSARLGGMVICPCSGSTLQAVAQSASGNLIQRAAEVQLKERRKLILVPRETPLSLPHLENLKRACEAGAVILPAAPGWYHGVRGLPDLVDFIVARILDQLDVEHQLMRRWGAPSGQPPGSS